MTRRILLLPVITLACLFVLAGAGHEQPGRVNQTDGTVSSAGSGQNHSLRIGADTTVRTEVSDPGLPRATAAAASLYGGSWWTVTSGGATEVASTSYRMGLSVAQPVSGKVSGTAWELAMGYWYRVSGQPAACPITLPGDVQQNGGVTTGDIIYLVNFVFKLGPDPLPCIGAADLDCSGNISSADIIYLVNKVLKAGPDPCDMCTLIPSVWTCP